MISQQILKYLISAGLIVAISQLAQRSSFWGAVLASVPLVSVLAMCWLYWDTQNVQRVSQFAVSTFWMVLPSLGLFIVLPILLHYKFNFYWALFSALIVMIIAYFIMIFILRKFNIYL